MMVRLKPCSRPLYIIAPDLWQCHKAALAHGLDPETMENTRCITRATQLRGVSPSTPFITDSRGTWVRAMPEVYHLDQAIDTLTRLGRLRVAGPDDIAAACGERAEAAE